MDAIEKTHAHVRVFLPVTKLVPNADNPNSMTDAEFNMLADNIEQTGVTDPILVRPLEDGTYRIVGGHHRFEVAKLAGFEELPCTVITDPEFDDDKEAFQVVRMNVIRGKMDPTKFLAMYQKLNSKYQDAAIAEGFGFANEAEFRKLIAVTKASLPKEMQADFDKAAGELKTIDDLSKLLQSLFSRYGTTLPYGYMLLDFGGKDSVWLRMQNDTRKAVYDLGEYCIEHKRTMDDIVGGLVRMASAGKLDDVLVQLLAQSPEVELPEDVLLPTYEALSAGPTPTE